MIFVAILFVLLNVAYFFVLSKYARQLSDPIFREEPLVQQPVAVTIIVPFRNEAERLPALLASIRQLHYPVELLSVIFVDDYSDDTSLTQLKDVQLPFKYNVVLSKGGGKKQALQTGIELAESDWVWTIDADVTLGENTLMHLVQATELYAGTHMVCGRVRIGEGRGALAAIQRMETETLQLSAMAALKLGHPLLNSGACLLFRKDAWKEVGGYAAHAAMSSGDDTFLMLDIHRRWPGAVKGAEWAIVETQPQEHISGFFAQRIRWAGKVRKYNDAYIGRIGYITVASAVVTSCSWGFLLLDPSEFSLSCLLTMIVLRYLPERELLRLSGLSFSRSAEVAMSMVYPFILLTVGVLAPWVKVDWKGRRVEQG